ncbi:hypothetical protein [Bacteroides uniformis]|uniref:hypothetical protein n=1 Tax=Bacteroides uniformis TaxID=820 RepID=UPI0012D832C6|nr:hypothetical protein [Bacteroides uniformis]
MYVDAGDSIPPTSTRCRVPAVQGFSGKYRSSARMIFLKTACGLTLLSRWGRGLPLSVGMGLPGISIRFMFILLFAGFPS